MLLLIQIIVSGLRKMQNNYNAEWEIVEISHELICYKESC